jgi:hypothetical protein
MGELVLFLILGGGIWVAIALGQSASKRQQAVNSTSSVGNSSRDAHGWPSSMIATPTTRWL